MFYSWYSSQRNIHTVGFNLMSFIPRAALHLPDRFQRLLIMMPSTKTIWSLLAEPSFASHVGDSHGSARACISASLQPCGLPRHLMGKWWIWANERDAAPPQVLQEVVWRTCSQLRGVPEPDVHLKQEVYKLETGSSFPVLLWGKVKRRCHCLLGGRRDSRAIKRAAGWRLSVEQQLSLWTPAVRCVMVVRWWGVGVCPPYTACAGMQRADTGKQLLYLATHTPEHL